MTNTSVALSAPTNRSPRAPRPEGRRRVTRADRAEMVRLYERGLSAATVALQLSMSKGCVLRNLTIAGVTVRPRGNPGRAHSSRPLAR
jgi:hypothetical protein